MAYPKLARLIKFVRKEVPNPAGENELEDFIYWVSEKLSNSVPGIPVKTIYSASPASREIANTPVEGGILAVYKSGSSMFMSESEALYLDWYGKIDSYAAFSISKPLSDNYWTYFFITAGTGRVSAPKWNDVPTYTPYYAANVIDPIPVPQKVEHRFRLAPDIISVKVEIFRNPDTKACHIVMSDIVVKQDLRNSGSSGSGGV